MSSHISLQHNPYNQLSEPLIVFSRLFIQNPHIFRIMHYIKGQGHMMALQHRLVIIPQCHFILRIYQIQIIVTWMIRIMYHACYNHSCLL